MALLRYCVSSEPSINGYCIFYDENLCAEQTPAGATHCLFSCLEPGFPWNLGLWLQWLLQRSPRGDLYPYWAWEFHKQVEEMLCCSGRVCVSENHWRLFPSQLCSQEALDWLLKLSETALSPVYHAITGLTTWIFFSYWYVIKHNQCLRNVGLRDSVVGMLWLIAVFLCFPTAGTFFWWSWLAWSCCELLFATLFTSLLTWVSQ